jgi:hypothetical protein
MRPLLLGTAAVVLTAAVNLLPAAAGPRDLVDNASPHLPQAAVATPSPRYQWQYDYAGRHARLRGHWVLVR